MLFFWGWKERKQSLNALTVMSRITIRHNMNRAGDCLKTLISGLWMQFF